jgi:hypothetical protein
MYERSVLLSPLSDVRAKVRLPLSAYATCVSDVKQIHDARGSQVSLARPMRPLGTFAFRAQFRRRSLRVSPSNPPPFHRLARFFSSTPSTSRAGKPPKDRFNYNPDIFFDEAPDPDHMRYARVTSNDLEQHTKPPTRVKMLVRDFIEDSLYNPHYGYFPQQATIFTSAGDPIDFRSMRDSAEFQNEVARRYSTYGTDEEGPGRQIWHTPTELFKVRPASDVHGSGR